MNVPTRTPCASLTHRRGWRVKCDASWKASRLAWPMWACTSQHNTDKGHSPPRQAATEAAARDRNRAVHATAWKKDRLPLRWRVWKNCFVTVGIPLSVDPAGAAGDEIA